ncbi:hypothetical protein [Companilactobacillus ginsenosidimutans]|uniref:Uncharacterized protein n=1 Tax=Companilactobacillus ginsenosidimutans TaxID=1007676 RepID=A0A0H4R1R7_9LACO|nr:hypothetical protein [Companilactobacillus ginsenosidimutans]AKP67680.1 hypothetical protein ABM34_09165 [Companilactobacillus ginsenosidimutans]
MTNTKKYFLKRAIMITFMAIVVAVWLMTAAHNNSGLYVFLIIVLAVYSSRINKKAGLEHTNSFKTDSEGYSIGLKHDDELEARNAAVASFISARITITFVILIMALVAAFYNGKFWDFFGFTMASQNIFNATSFGIFGAAILLVQQWSFFFGFNHLSK